jgi:hypothetical protein
MKILQRRKEKKIKNKNTTGNAIFQIFPYRSGKTWAFDDPGRGLVGEPFVAGIPEIIEGVCEILDLHSDRLCFTFSAQKFPGSQVELHLEGEEMGGAWYVWQIPKRILLLKEDLNFFTEDEKRGWLCPAALKFFDRFPSTIYVQVAEA